MFYSRLSRSLDPLIILAVRDTHRGALDMSLYCDALESSDSMGVAGALWDRVPADRLEEKGEWFFSIGTVSFKHQSIIL